MALMVTCLLCDRELSPLAGGFYFTHPDVEDCQVRYCDRFGVSVEEDDALQTPATELVEVDTPRDLAKGDFVIDLDPYPRVDEVLKEIFATYGLQRLGGQSTGRGWSSFNLFQKCPHAWKRRYIDAAQPSFVVEAPSLAVGTLVHTFLAVMYMRMIVDDYPLTPELVRSLCMEAARPAYVDEAWRVFTGYRLFYTYDKIEPLAVEYDLRDPRTGESCRYDLIAFFPEESGLRMPGTYVVEHKTASRFDIATTDGWANDGEVLGQALLWKRLGLDKRFGPLRGVIVNICGKQKELQFHRTIVAPSSLQLDQHTEDLRRWEGLIQLSRATNNFPRARHSCVGRFGMCEWFEDCITAKR
jgi:hypothetical protein